MDCSQSELDQAVAALNQQAKLDPAQVQTLAVGLADRLQAKCLQAALNAQAGLSTTAVGPPPEAPAAPVADGTPAGAPVGAPAAPPAGGPGA